MHDGEWILGHQGGWVKMRADWERARVEGLQNHLAVAHTLVDMQRNFRMNPDDPAAENIRSRVGENAFCEFLDLPVRRLWSGKSDPGYDTTSRLGRIDVKTCVGHPNFMPIQLGGWEKNTAHIYVMMHAPLDSHVCWFVGWDYRADIERRNLPLLRNCYEPTNEHSPRYRPGYCVARHLLDYPKRLVYLLTAPVEEV